MPHAPRSVEEAVRDHYRTRALAPDALAALAAQVRAATPAPRAADRSAALPPRRRASRWAVATAAALVLGLATWTLWPTATGDAPSVAALTGEAVASEVALTHTRRLAPDVRASSWESLDLPKLDFAVAQPAAMDETLLGARYGMLGGEMAAQIHLRDARGRPCTLIQVRDGEPFRSLAAGRYRVGGVQVRVWREAGLVMALAEPV